MKPPIFPRVIYLLGFAFRRSLILVIISAILSACGGSDVSTFDDDDIPSPVAERIDEQGNIIPSDPGAEPVDDEALALLPTVSLTPRQFADPNVLVTLSADVSAVDDAQIVATRWVQISGPAVTIANPTQLESGVIIPDLQAISELRFQLVVQDSEQRINAATTVVVVQPRPSFASVVGGVVDEAAQEAVFTIRFAAPQATDVTVNYRTIDGTALADLDYLSTASSVVFAAGETERQVAIPVYINELGESDEYFGLQIAVLAEGDASANAGVAVIQNNRDATPVEQVIVFVDPGPITLDVEQSLQNPIDPSSAPGSGALSYRSADTSVATVDSEGTVTAIAAGETTITATKAADATFPLSVATFMVIVSESQFPAPLLFLEDAIRRYDPGAPISPIFFDNRGGAELTSCTVEPALPSGLSIAVSGEDSTCEISGTPDTPQESTSYAVTATNTGGSSVASVAIQINEFPPLLRDVGPQTFLIGLPISPLSFVSEAGPPASCIADVLPVGLALNPDIETNSCVLSGTPDELREASETIITATNGGGSDTSAVSLEVTLRPQQLVFESERVLGFIGTNGFSFLVEPGAGSGDIRYTSSTPDIVSVTDPDLGDVRFIEVGNATITATKAADALYAGASASYDALAIAGGNLLFASSPDLVSSDPTLYDIDGILDLNEDEDNAPVGFAADATSGTIVLTFANDRLWDLDSFVLWNSFALSQGGIDQFTLRFYGEDRAPIDPGFPTTYNGAPPEEFDLEEYTFPTTITRVQSVEIEIASAFDFISLREVAFTGSEWGLEQTIGFADSTPVFGFVEERFARPITLSGEGSGAITYSSSNSDVAAVNPTTGEVDILSIGVATITATKAGDTRYRQTSASYEVNGVIGDFAISAFSDLVALTDFPLAQINDGVTADAPPLFNGFATNASRGVISFGFAGNAYDLTTFLLWNDINVQAEGVRDFTLRFFDCDGALIDVQPGFMAASGQIGVQSFSLLVDGQPLTDVASVELEVLSSHSGGFAERIEIREVAFAGAPVDFCPE